MLYLFIPITATLQEQEISFLLNVALIYFLFSWKLFIQKSCPLKNVTLKGQCLKAVAKSVHTHKNNHFNSILGFCGCVCLLSFWVFAKALPAFSLTYEWYVSFGNIHFSFRYHSLSTILKVRLLISSDTNISLYKISKKR